MSLVINTTTPEGIVLSADSRQSFRNRKGMARIGSDNASKLFQLNKRIGVAVTGLAFLPEDGVMKNISKFIEQSLGQAPQSIAKATVSAITETAGLIKKIIPERFIKTPKILIGGEKGIAFKLAMCCHPKQTDKILAFITQGEGASIHKETCLNLIELKQKWPERIVPATWV